LEKSVGEERWGRELQDSVDRSWTRVLEKRFVEECWRRLLELCCREVLEKSVV